MKLCLTCRGLSKGGALFCARCGRSFGAPRCRRGHPNSPGAAFCRVCGVPGLSLPTSYVPLGFVPLGIGTVLILGLLWGALHFVWPWLAGTFAGRLPSPLAVFDRVLSLVLTWGLLLFLVSLFLPAPLKKGLWRILSIFGRGVWKLLWRARYDRRY